jgi:hypothetical protein
MRTIQVTELFNTGRFILTESEFQNPQVFAELKKYDNIILGDKFGPTMIQALIDNSIVMLCKNTIQHPQGGIIHIIEVL